MMDTIFQVITLSWALTGGQVLEDAKQIDTGFIDSAPYFFKTGFEFEIPISWVKGGKDQFYIGAETESQFFINTEGKFQGEPWQDSYRLLLGMRLWGIELGYWHECVHPVVVDTRLIDSSFFSSKTEIFLKIEGNI